MREFLSTLLIAIIFGGALIGIFYYAMKEVKEIFGKKTMILILIIVLLLLFAFASKVFAQNYVEDQTNGNLEHIVSVSALRIILQSAPRYIGAGF